MVLNHLPTLQVASIPVNRLTVNLLPIVMANRATLATDHLLVRTMGLLVVKDMDNQDLQVMDNPQPKAMGRWATKAMGNSTHRVTDKETLLIMVGQAVRAARTMDSRIVRIMDNQVIKDTANRHRSSSMERMAILATNTAAIHHLQRLLGKLRSFAFTRVLSGSIESRCYNWRHGGRCT